MSKQKTWYRQSMVMGALKKLWVKSPMYKAVKDAAKVPYVAKKKDGSDSKAHRVKYRCAHCKGLFVDKAIQMDPSKKKKTKILQVDHVMPVISPEEGFKNLVDWIERQFVGITVWDPKIHTIKDLEGKVQLLCFWCHTKKSAQENQIRLKVKKKQKAV